MAEKEQFSRWGLIFAAIGMAIGTGNIWRFPRVSAVNGGGAFMIAYILAIFLWAIPLLMAEGVWGKATRMGVIGSFKEMLGGKYTWMGGVVAWISLAIAFYYAVVLGWCIRYMVYALTGVINAGLDSEALWNSFKTSPGQMVTFHLVAMAISIAVISLGVKNGLDKGNKIMIPIIFILLIYLAFRAIMLPGASKGLEYLFTIRVEDIFKANTWLQAFAQVSWSTGAGWGLFLTYFVYAKKDQDIALGATTTCFADTTVALLAGMAVIPTIFSLSADPMAVVKSDNTGITFIHLTKLFGQMDGGTIMAIAFFLALILAALTSEISMLELGIRIMRDMGWKRVKAVWFVGISVTILGLPSSLNINFLDNQDWVWGLGLLVSGLFFALGAIKIGPQKIWDQHIAPTTDLHHPWMFKLIILFPLWFLLLFGWWIMQSIGWYPGQWYKCLPISDYTSTVGTFIYQMVLAITIIFLLNKWLSNRMKNKAEVYD